MNFLEQMGIQQWSLQQKPIESSVKTQSQSSELSELGWEELHELVKSGVHCECCKNYGGILGVGDESADFIFIVDAPNSKDIETQQLLSGRKGKLYDAILQSIGLNRENSYLCSVMKCPSINNSNLSAECGKLIHRQIELVNAKVVLAIGESTVQAILRSNDCLSSLRIAGINNSHSNTPVVCTYSLQQMLDRPELKAQVWEDLKKCLTYL